MLLSGVLHWHTPEVQVCWTYVQVQHTCKKAFIRGASVLDLRASSTHFYIGAMLLSGVQVGDSLCKKAWVDNTLALDWTYVGAMSFLRCATILHLRCNGYGLRVQRRNWQHTGPNTGVTLVQWFFSEVQYFDTWDATFFDPGCKLENQSAKKCWVDNTLAPSQELHACNALSPGWYIYTPEVQVCWPRVQVGESLCKKAWVDNILARLDLRGCNEFS